jgi:protein-S-isoprenylcysteine O-methyltransferase Ste14
MNVASNRFRMSLLPLHRTTPRAWTEGDPHELKVLVGSGDRIGLFALPFAVVGVLLNVLVPSVFSVGRPAPSLRLVLAVVLAAGIAIWAWSVVLILIKVPRGELITRGPYAWVKHPLYTSVGLLVLPAGGFLLHSSLGALLGVALYLGSRLFAPEEERFLAKTFGATWDDYLKRVWLPWL